MSMQAVGRGICLLLLLSVVLSVPVRLYQTAEGTRDRLSEKSGLHFHNSSRHNNWVRVDAAHEYQSILGFGGAFTEAAAINFAALNPTLQEEVLQLYWGHEGIGYSMGRVHMNSCDFSLFSYNFDTTPGDTSLLYFDNDVTHDQHTMIPFILRANATATQAGHPIHLFVTPWSPPAWMKIPVNGKQSMDGSALPNGLEEEYMASWAQYFIKFIQAYENSGVNMWGLTIQNEPENQAEWEACVYNATYESYFVANYLGPAIRQAYPHLKMMGYDHNRDHVFQWASTLYANETTRDYLDGIAFHWYLSNQLYNVNRTHFLDPSKFVLATEGCNCPGVELGNWARAESYGRDIIADLNFWSVGWVDWNLVLNMKGGPNHVGNFCDAMVITDPVAQQLYIQPSYYYMGQISKFVPRGAKRVHSATHVRYDTPVGQVPYAENGFNVILAECNGAPNQLWQVSNSAADQTIALQASAMCLDVDSSTTSEDAPNAQVYQCASHDVSQQWTVDATNGQIQAQGLCMDVLGQSTQSGANVEMQACASNSTSQQWKVYNDGMIESVSSGLCLTSGWSTWQHVAFTTPDEETVLIVMNSSDNELTFSIEDSRIPNQYVEATMPAHAIQTFVWDSPV